MGKRRTSHPGPDFYKVQGGHVEDRDVTALSKQALVREAARLKRRPITPAPRRKRAAKVAKPEPIVVPEALVRANDREIGREFARMNERRQPRRVARAEPLRDEDYPTYLGGAARGVIRRVVRLALTPLVLARAVVDHFRHHE